MCICVHINIKTYKQENNKTLKVVRVTLRQSVLPLSVPLWAAWQRYRSVSPHFDLNILFVETYQITLIWYYHTRPLQSLNSEPVNVSGRSQVSLVFSDLHLFSFWGHPSNGAVFQSSCPISAGVAHRHPDGTLLFS